MRPHFKRQVLSLLIAISFALGAPNAQAMYHELGPVSRRCPEISWGPVAFALWQGGSAVVGSLAVWTIVSEYLFLKEKVEPLNHLECPGRNSTDCEHILSPAITDTSRGSLQWNLGFLNEAGIWIMIAESVQTGASLLSLAGLALGRTNLLFSPLVASGGFAMGTLIPTISHSKVLGEIQSQVKDWIQQGAVNGTALPLSLYQVDADLSQEAVKTREVRIYGSGIALAGSSWLPAAVFVTFGLYGGVRYCLISLSARVSRPAT